MKIEIKLPDTTKLKSAIGSRLRALASFRNELMLIMIMMMAMWGVQKGIDYWNTNEVGTRISKWDYTYLLIEFYSLIRLCVALLGVKVTLMFISPVLGRFGELDFETEYLKIRGWQKIVIFLFVYFALVFGVIWLSTSQTAGMIAA